MEKWLAYLIAPFVFIGFWYHAFQAMTTYQEKNWLMTVLHIALALTIFILVYHIRDKE